MFPHRSLSFCTLILVLSVFCPAVQPQEPPKEDFLKLMRPNLPAQRGGMKTIIRSFWDGSASNTMLFPYLQDPGVRKGLGFSDADFAKAQKTTGQIVNMYKYPEFVSLHKELQELTMLNATDEKTVQKIAEIEQKRANKRIEVMNQEVNKLLTPEQKTKFQEFQLAIILEMPLISSKSFDVLGLSEKQQKQMADIKKELTPQLDQLADEMIASESKLQDKIYKKLKQENASISDLREFMKKFGAAREELWTDEEFKKMRQEIMKKGKGFVVQAKFKMFDVLTDEQMAKLQDIVDNPPDYVKDAIAKFKERMSGNASGNTWDLPNTSDPPWFVNAWRPGDPIPEEYLEKRNINSKRRFPKTKKEKE